jgi:hypothetical protein
LPVDPRPGSQPELDSGRGLLGGNDWLKATAAGVVGGLILRAGFEITVSRAGFVFLAAAMSGQDPRAALLARAWLLGGVFITLGAAAVAAALVREHRTTWVLVAMACVAIPLLTP